MGRIIGIDLGTTNSVIAVMDGDYPIIIPNAEGEKLTPSVVAFDARTHQLLVGTSAKRQAIINPQNTIFSIKRKIGTDYKLKIFGREYTPQEISAFILKKIKQDAEVFLGENVTQAVITVPSYFNANQRQATMDAGNIAGLEVVRIISEPTAAYLACGLHEDKEKKVAVYHFGGGTLDVTIMDIGKGVFEVISTSGDIHLGGDDFDQCIIDWVCSEFKKEHNVDLHQDKMTFERLREAAENAKCELSFALQTDINLPYITTSSGVSKNLLLTLTREKLKELVGDLIDKTLVPCKQAMTDAGLTSAHIDEIILVGQQTRMPAVQEAVKKFFGKDLCHKQMDPAETVALGAAVQAGILAGNIKDLLLLDVIPISLGIEGLGGIFTRVVDRNTNIPTRRSQVFSTAVDNQISVNIHVFQGERVMAMDNTMLGKFDLTGILPAPKSFPQIEVTFDIDVNGIMHVTAKDLRTSKEQSIRITAPLKLSKEEIDRMIKDAERLKNDERNRIDANKMISKTEEILSNQRNHLSFYIKNVVRKFWGWR